MKDRLVYELFRFAAGVVGLLPEGVARGAGELAGRAAWHWAGPRKSMAIRHMQRVLEDRGDAERAARQVFRAYGRYWAEVFWIRPSRTPGILARTTTEGLHHILAARDRGEGMVYALPHIGNWEMAGPVARREQIELVAVAEALANARVAGWFVALRESLGIEVLLAGRTSGLTGELLAVLGRGGAVALVTDRDLTGRGVPVTFFGEPTTLPAGAATLAAKAGVRIFPLAVFFKEGAGHHIIIQPPLEVPEGVPRDQQVAQVTQSLAERLETLIRHAPTQWHLVQPNWPSDREA